MSHHTSTFSFELASECWEFLCALSRNDGVSFFHSGVQRNAATGTKFKWWPQLEIYLRCMSLWYGICLCNNYSIEVLLLRDAEANEIVLCQTDAYIHIRPRNVGVALKGATIIKCKAIESCLNCTLHMLKHHKSLLKVKKLSRNTSSPSSLEIGYASREHCEVCNLRMQSSQVCVKCWLLVKDVVGHGILAFEIHSLKTVWLSIKTYWVKMRISCL